MSRILWLAYERPPHPDAVAHPADEREVQLVLDLLARSEHQRAHIAEQLSNFLIRQDTLPVFCRESIPCRCSSGVYRLVPWRLAKWLAKALRARGSAHEKTTARLRTWLANCDCPTVVNPDSQETPQKIFSAARNRA